MKPVVVNKTSYVWMILGSISFGGALSIVKLNTSRNTTSIEVLYSFSYTITYMVDSY
ncbi:hypothetical protein ANAPRD1_00850 [Anaplasma phagocytophilum]|nr:hypothetical protein ANAPRD1_00850 [Anaplasma phagocytophilum]